MSLATEGYECVLNEMDLPVELKIELKFMRICLNSFDFEGRIKFVDHINNMADRLKEELINR